MDVDAEDLQPLGHPLHLVDELGVAGVGADRLVLPAGERVGARAEHLQAPGVGLLAQLGQGRLEVGPGLGHRWQTPVMISMVHSNSSCLAFGCSPPGWPSPSTARMSVAALASSPVPRSTTSSSTSMPRLGPGELLKSICTGGSCRREAYGLALPEETGRRVGRRPAATVRPRWAQAAGVATRPRGVRMSEALADEERLVHVLDGLGRLADARWPGWTAPPGRRRSARTARRARPGRPCRGRARRPRRWPGPPWPRRGRRCRRPAPRRSRGPGAAAGWRCGACPGPGGRSRGTRRRRPAPRGCAAARSTMASRSAGS